MKVEVCWFHKKNTATGYDEINSMLLKLSIEFIVNPLTHICNMSLSEGVIPDRMKIANVKPLYKADDPLCFNHYRPVSLLCVLSKVFEKMMYKRLHNFLEKNQYLKANKLSLHIKNTHYMMFSNINR